MDDPGHGTFECLNCGIQSCRHCRVKSHLPLTCEGRRSDTAAVFDGSLSNQEQASKQARRRRRNDKGIGSKVQQLQPSVSQRRRV